MANSVKDINKIFSQSITNLVFNEPFYGHILQSITRKFTDTIPTAAVALNNQHVELLINEKYFVKKLNDSERIAVLKHEVLHLVLKHLFRNKNYHNKRLLYNIAADLVVNQYIGDWELPVNAITLNSFPDLKLMRFQSLDYYIAQLIKIEHELLKNINKDAVIDLHPTWDNNFDDSNFNNEIISNNLDQIIIDSFELDIRKGGYGSIPKEIKHAIYTIKSNYTSNIDWKRSIKIFSQNSIRSNIKSTFKRISKRFNYRPGIKIKKSEKLLLAIDTSGSISNKELNIFFTEIFKIANTGAEIDIIECDAKVHAFYKFNGKIPTSINGRGGTNFDPVFEFINYNKLNYDGCIYLTDGYAPEPKVKSNTKLLWVVTNNSDTKHLINGKVIKLNINEHKY